MDDYFHKVGNIPHKSKEKAYKSVLIHYILFNYRKTHKHKHNIASVSTLTNLQNYTTPLSIFDISKTESYFLHLFLSDEMFFLIKYRIRKRFSSPCEKNISYYLVSNDLTK